MEGLDGDTRGVASLQPEENARHGLGCVREFVGGRVEVNHIRRLVEISAILESEPEMRDDRYVEARPVDVNDLRTGLSGNAGWVGLLWNMKQAAYTEHSKRAKVQHFH